MRDPDGTIINKKFPTVAALPKQNIKKKNMEKEHHYKANIRWTGNRGSGTTAYKSYERSHTISIDGKPDILASSDPGFLGDPSCHNPEDLLLASLSGCHMLWYLHLCSVNKVIVTEYAGEAGGIMKETEDGGGSFISVTLKPVVKVREASMKDKALELHHKANKLCFIARSVNFPVYHQPVILAEDE